MVMNIAKVSYYWQQLHEVSQMWLVRQQKLLIKM
jgi:hypothetical protein